MNLGKIYNDFETQAPPLFPTGDGLQFVENSDGVLGLGYPQYFILDSSELYDMISAFPAFTGSTNCFYTDVDGDGTKDMIASLGTDFTGDGLSDFAYVIDLNGNGIPDVNRNSVFYPVGSPDYDRILSSAVETDIYTIMNKPISEYTVTEGILLIFLIVGAFKLIGKSFRRKRVVK